VPLENVIRLSTQAAIFIEGQIVRVQRQLLICREKKSDDISSEIYTKDRSSLWALFLSGKCD